MEKRIYYIFLIALLSLITHTVQAQVENNFPERGLFMEFGASIGSSNDHFIPSTNKYKSESYGILSPGIGFKINNDFNIGLRLGIEVGSSRYNFKPKVTVFGQYNFVKLDNLKIFIEPRVAYAKNGRNYMPSPWNISLWEAGFGFGMNYSLSNRLSLQLRYLQIGYCHTTENALRYNHSPGCLGNDSWIADFGLRRLELSLRYILPVFDK